MKTNRYLIHICIIISCLVLAVGAAIGTVCHFIGGGFFNYGAENSSGASITVSYYVVDYTQSEVEEICSSAFEQSSLSGYTLKTSEADGYIEYAFSSMKDETAFKNAVAIINSALANGTGNEYSINRASYHVYESQVGGTNAYIWASIAAAIAIGIQAVYVAIRYKLDMALVSLITNIQSVLLLAAILAITRISFGVYTIAVFALCLIITVIAQQLFFSRARAALKDEETAKLPAAEKIAAAKSNSFKGITWLCAAMLIVCVVYGAAVAIATLGISAAMPALAAACACVVGWYSSALCAPALYTAIRVAAENRKKAKAN